MQCPPLSPDALVLFQTGGDADWGFLSLLAAAALQKCSRVCCCLLMSTTNTVCCLGFLKFVGFFFFPCEDRNRKGLLYDASFQGHSFVPSCCENGVKILARSTLSFEMLKVCLHGRWGRVYSSSVWMSLSTRLPGVNNDGFVVTLTKKQFAYPTQPTQSKRTWRLRLPSQECFIRAHSHVPASVLSWPYSAFFFLILLKK